MSQGSHKVKVYYEDTDAGGVVYHANYLRFMERARTELMASSGMTVADYHRAGLFLRVTHIDIDYRRPAFLGDLLDITAEPEEIKKASITIRQKIMRDGELVAEARVKIVCVDRNGKPIRLPEGMNTAFGSSED